MMRRLVCGATALYTLSAACGGDTGDPDAGQCLGCDRAALSDAVPGVDAPVDAGLRYWVHGEVLGGASGQINPAKHLNCPEWVCDWPYEPNLLTYFIAEPDLVDGLTKSFFAGWGGACADQPYPQCNLRIDSDKIISARFEPCDVDVHEPNGSLETAAPTGIPEASLAFADDLVSICGYLDVPDWYQLGVATDGTAVRAEIVYQEPLGFLTVDVRDSAGTVLATGVDIAPRTVSADVPAAVAGVYYVVVRPTGEGIRQNNYDISIETTPP